MYEELDTKRKGRKASMLNIRLQNALTVTTPISNQSLINILLQCNIIPPSYSGMQTTANRVCSDIIEINKASMKSIRETIMQENKDCGLSDPTLIRAESDGRFNNPMFKGDTPFQAGTQVTYVMCENNSNLKRIISVFTGNKLCNAASRLRNEGSNVVCPNHPGICTANIAQDESIGNESKWSYECVKEINDTLIISHLTTDGDSKAVIGVKRAQQKDVCALKDIRHLSQTMRRYIMNTTFSPKMFVGPKAWNLKCRFAYEVTRRCVAELNSAHTMLNNHIEYIDTVMQDTINAVIMCMKGYCGYSCQNFSFVCKGLKHDHWIKRFLPRGPIVRMSGDDEMKLFSGIEILLGTDSLHRTKYLTSTQKSEAFNKVLQRVNPKSATWSRNFPGRVHTAVHITNHGFVESALIRCEKLGVPLTKGSSVIKHLKAKSIVLKRQRKVHMTHSFRQKRCATRTHKFRLHIVKHSEHVEEYEKGVSDPLPAKPNCKGPRKTGVSKIHGYADLG